LTYFKGSIDKLNKHIQNLGLIEKLEKLFLQLFFGNLEFVWFFCALSIVLFKLNFQTKEILLTIIIPLAFSIFRQFTKDNSSQLVGKKEV